MALENIKRWVRKELEGIRNDFANCRNRDYGDICNLKKNLNVIITAWKYFLFVMTWVLWLAFTAFWMVIAYKQHIKSSPYSFGNLVSFLFIWLGIWAISIVYAVKTIFMIDKNVNEV